MNLEQELAYNDFQRTALRMARAIVKSKRKIYRNEVDGFYEFGGRNYRTKKELLVAVVEWLQQPENIKGWSGR